MMLLRSNLVQALAMIIVTAAVGTAQAIPTYSQVILSDNPSGYWQYEDANTGAGAADSALGNGAQN
ncbi:MAG: hypothetical protein WD768_06920, partial [Phycisphaeraceae bacterium]